MAAADSPRSVRISRAMFPGWWREFASRRTTARAADEGHPELPVSRCHYTANGKPATDVTKIGVYFTDEAPKYPLRQFVSCSIRG